MATFGYSVGGEQDLQTIAAYADSCGLTVAATFQDPKSWCTLWRQRENGSRLAKLLQPGDHVIMGSGAFAGAADFLQTVKDLAPRNITVHLAQVRWRTGSTSLTIGKLEAPLVEQVVAAHADATFQWNSECVSRGMARAAEAGKKYCRDAGYGRRWLGGQRVVDEQECATIQVICELRRRGFSWHRIAVHLLRHGVRTRTGAEWSASRCRRAFLRWYRPKSGPKA